MLKHMRYFPSNVQLFPLTASREPRQNQKCSKKKDPASSKNKNSPPPQPQPEGPSSPDSWPGAVGHAGRVRCQPGHLLCVTCPPPRSARPHSPVSDTDVKQITVSEFFKRENKNICVSSAFPAMKPSQLKRTHGRM